MLLKRFKVRVIEAGLRAHLAEVHQPSSWLITASDLGSAWGKFRTQHFGTLGPNPADYDVHFDGIIVA